LAAPAACSSRHVAATCSGPCPVQDRVLPSGWPGQRGRLRPVAAPSGTVTFLFTDIEGSTRLWQEDEVAMRAALSRHDELLRFAVSEQGGTVISSMGDGIAAAFPAASAAVRAALSAQHMLGAETWPTATPIRVRMGLHTGEAELRDGDYFGTTVNRAARLMAVGHGGQILCSSATAELVPDTVVLADLGEHRLRDLDRPMHVFQVSGGSFAALRSLDILPGNLPVQLTSFVGRDQELAALSKELGVARLVTLKGVGGVGKTRLAVQVAAELVPGFADGVWLCELAAAATGEDMAQVVAIALGVVQRTQMTLAESIVDFLRPRRMLIVLDNCEHLLDAVGGLATAILGGAPGVRILATSREGLGIPGEHVRPLRSLEVSDRDGRAGDAVVLFTDRAQAADPDFELDAASAAAVVDICRRVDGIALAIELAAARVTTMTAAEIAGHLDERFRLLTGGHSGRVERHRTLRAALEWSYSLLADTERLVFDRLGVFPATFDADAAVAVCADDRIDRWDVIDGLTGLVAKSMVATEKSGEVTRFQLLETLRHFARDRVAAGGDPDGLRRRHAAHYSAFAVQVGAGLMSADELVWRARLVPELDNLRAATRWAFDAPGHQDVALGVAVLGGLMSEIMVKPKWGIQGWAGAALPRVERLSVPQRSVVVAAAALDAFYVGQFDRAKTLAAQVIGEADTLTLALLDALFAAAFSAAVTGDPGEGMAILAEGHQRPGGDEAYDYAAAGLGIITAWLAYSIGDTDTARSEVREALVFARRVKAPSGFATALSTHARVLAEEDPDSALAAAEESIRLAEAGAGDSGYGAALSTAAMLRVARGDTAGAARAMHAAVEHAAWSGQVVLATELPFAVLVLASNPAGMHAAATVAGAVGGDLILLNSEKHRHQYADAVAHLAETLGAGDFTDAQHHGAAMTYDELVPYTLDQLSRLAKI